MTTTDIQSHIPFREVTDGNGRVYRLGETDRDIMRRPRWTMVLFPWLGMM
ncbi:MFS transporter, partial [Streptomyces sp900116325]